VGVERTYGHGPRGREAMTLAADMEVLLVIPQDWQIYFVARYMLDV
jgi:hypothetical protein